MREVKHQLSFSGPGEFATDHENYKVKGPLHVDLVYSLREVDISFGGYHLNEVAEVCRSSVLTVRIEGGGLPLLVPGVFRVDVELAQPRCAALVIFRPVVCVEDGYCTDSVSEILRHCSIVPDWLQNFSERVGLLQPWVLYQMSDTPTVVERR